MLPNLQLLNLDAPTAVKQKPPQPQKQPSDETRAGARSSTRVAAIGKQSDKEKEKQLAALKAAREKAEEDQNLLEHQQHEYGFVKLTDLYEEAHGSLPVDIETLWPLQKDKGQEDRYATYCIPSSRGGTIKVWNDRTNQYDEVPAKRCQWYSAASLAHIIVRALQGEDCNMQQPRCAMTRDLLRAEDVERILDWAVVQTQKDQNENRPNPLFTDLTDVDLLDLWTRWATAHGRPVPERSGVLSLTNVFPADGTAFREALAHVVRLNQPPHNHPQYGPIAEWDTSRVTDMSYAFAMLGTTDALSTAPGFKADLSRWNTSNVTNMHGMFQGVRYIDCNISNWKTSKVKNMSSMFAATVNFNPDLSRWNTSRVENMSHMFHSASNFNSDLSSWDTSSVTKMQYMFRMARSFNGDISRWNTWRVQKMMNMFEGAENFSCDLWSWDTRNVEDMSFMFKDAHSFKADLSRWNTSKVRDMSSMFQNAHSFESDLSRWDTTRVKSMDKMFENAYVFQSDLQYWNTS